TREHNQSFKHLLRMAHERHEMRTTGTVLGREPVFDRALISVGKASNQLNRSVRFTEFAMKRIRDDRGEAGAPQRRLDIHAWKCFSKAGLNVSALLRKRHVPPPLTTLGSGDGTPGRHPSVRFQC